MNIDVGHLVDNEKRIDLRTKIQGRIMHMIICFSSVLYQLRERNNSIAD